MGEDKPPSPGKQFANILREGPLVGVHLLMWCDSYNNVIRALDRQGLRDVDYRVVFQMNATDSSNLIDTPVASRLGVHRAILYNEGRGTVEKIPPLRPADGRVDGFRPCPIVSGAPSDQLLTPTRLTRSVDRDDSCVARP